MCYCTMQNEDRISTEHCKTSEMCCMEIYCMTITWIMVRSFLLYLAGIKYIALILKIRLEGNYFTRLNMQPHVNFGRSRMANKLYTSLQAAIHLIVFSSFFFLPFGSISDGKTWNHHRPDTLDFVDQCSQHTTCSNNFKYSVGWYDMFSLGLFGIKFNLVLFAVSYLCQSTFIT